MLLPNIKTESEFRKYCADIPLGRCDKCLLKELVCSKFSILNCNNAIMDKRVNEIIILNRKQKLEKLLA